jgi:hypothetical protein
MNPWPVLLAMVVLAVLYVMVPVGLAMASSYRRPKLLRCPLTKADAAVVVGRSGLAEALGARSLRRIASCSLWPQRGCVQACRRLDEESMREVSTAN